MRRVREAEALWTIVLLLMTAVLVAATFAFQSWMPLSAFVIPLVLGALVLPMGRLIALVVTVAVCVAIIVATTEVEVRRWTALAVIALVAVTVLISARQRNRLGIPVPGVSRCWWTCATGCARSPTSGAAERLVRGGRDAVGRRRVVRR